MTTTKSLVVFDRISDPLSFAMQFGTELAKSRLFGCENESQGRVLALACIAERKNPIEIARTHHIIQGNLSMRADAMLAAFNSLGGKHRIAERTADRAEVELTIGDEVYTESLTWEEAQQEPYPYEKDGKALKKNWRTPRARRQMLWARVISEAVRTLRPGIVAGVYTPEEIDGFDTGDSRTNGKPADVEAVAKEAAAKAATEPHAVEDAEFVAKDAPAAKPQDDSSPNESLPSQREEIRILFESLDVTDEQITAVLAKRGVTMIRHLTRDQAGELIEGLKAKLAGKSRMPAEATESHETGPVDQTTIDEIKRLLTGDPDIVKQVKDHLVKHGKQKIADLSLADAELLRNCLEANQLESFFAASLMPGDGTPF